MVRLLLITAGVAAAAIPLSCGESPTGMEPVAWIPVAVAPADWHLGDCAAGPGGVYIVGEDWTEAPGRAAIFNYDGYNLTEVLVLPDEARKAEFQAIAFYGEKGWAVGGKRGMDRRPPYSALMYYFDGRSWREVPVPNKECGSLNAVAPINDRDCWLLGDVAGHLGGHLIKYEDGVFELYEELGIKAAMAVAPDNGTIYRPAYSHRNPALAISVDGGTSWVTESPDVPTLGHKFEEWIPVCAAGDELYLILRCQGVTPGIVRRSGPPGAGEYELEFLEVDDPEFGPINDVAMAAKRVAAVAESGAAIDEGRGWRREGLPYKINLRHVTPAAGGYGFWALGDNENVMGRTEVLYHP